MGELMELVIIFSVIFGAIFSVLFMVGNMVIDLFVVGLIMMINGGTKLVQKFN